MDFQWTGLDYQKALQRMGDNERLYSRILDSFVQEYGNFPERLQEMVQRESDDAYVLTHSLKNISASIGAQALTEAAEEMEGFFKERMFKDIELYMNRLYEEFQRVISKLQSKPHNEVSDIKTESIDLEDFIQFCRRALEHFSPSEIKKCRHWLQDAEWPDSLIPYTKPLLEYLKTYQYQEAASVLERMEKQLKSLQS